MCTYESNLSFEELKLEVKPEYWLKTEKIEIWEDTYLSFLRAKISKLRNFQGNWLHLGERVPEILLFSFYHDLTFCEKAKKSLEPNSRKSVD